MTEHLSPLQLKQLCVSAPPEDDLASAARHIADCEYCKREFVEALRHQRGSVPSNFTLEPEFWFRHDHVDFDLLVALADKTLDQEAEEILNIHLKICDRCREDVRSFLAFREATINETSLSHAPLHHKKDSDMPAAAWWRLQAKPVYAIAAILLLAVAVLIGVVALSKSSGRLEAKKQDQTNSGIEPSSDNSPPPKPNVSSSPSSIDESAKVAVLKDANGEITIEKNGRVSGLDEIQENSRHYIARVALTERLESPEVLRHLAGEQSGVRGDDGSPRFGLLYPVRRVVTEDRPVFRWESLPHASSYRVYVLDADGNQVSQSEELPSTETQWKAPAPFRRGPIFSWMVMGLIDGKKIISPPASAPEMKFAVLSAADVQELNHLKEANSHLALGVFYARTGLLDQAERELQTLIKLNPDSELPRKLLQSLRDIRHGR